MAGRTQMPYPKKQSQQSADESDNDVKYITSPKKWSLGTGRKKIIRRIKVPTRETVLERICTDLKLETPPTTLSTVQDLKITTRHYIENYSKGHGGRFSIGSGLAMLGISLNHRTTRRNEFTRRVRINYAGHERGYWIPTTQVMKRALSDYFNSQNMNFDETILTWDDLKAQPQLKRMLNLYSLGINKTTSVETALKKLGVQYKKDPGITLPQAKKALQLLYSLNECQKTYLGDAEISQLSSAYRNTQTSAGAALRAIRRGRFTDEKTGKRLNLEDFLRDLHPSLNQQYEISLDKFLIHSAIPQPIISEYLEKRTLQGKSLAQHIMRKSSERDIRFAAAIEYHRELLNQQIKKENDEVLKADPKAETKPLLTFTRMVEKLHKSEHITQSYTRNDQTSMNFIADSMQGFVHLLLMLAIRYDSDGTLMGPHFRKTFGTKLQEVWFETQGTQNREHVQLATAPGIKIYADGRLHADGGHSLIEVKTSYESAPSAMLESLQKYDGKNFWASLRPESLQFGQQQLHEEISRRIAILNTSASSFAQAESELSQNGWHTVNSRMMAAFLRRISAIVANKEPDLFSKLPMPLSEPARLSQLYQLIQSKTHIFNSPGFTKTTHWLRNMLTDNARALIFESFYQPQQSVKFMTTLAANQLHPAYKSIDWEEARDTIALDIEALSFHDREPIVSIALGYVRKKRAFADVYFARDPLEEGLILTEIQKRTERKRIVTYRGKYYDGRVINGRAAFHRLAPIIDPRSIFASTNNGIVEQHPGATESTSFEESQFYEKSQQQSHEQQNQMPSKERNTARHVDVSFGTHGYLQFAKKKQLLGATLQYLERDLLGIERHDDLSGAHIAQVYASYLRNHDVGNASRIIVHNGMDAVSTLAAYVAYKQGFNNFTASHRKFSHRQRQVE